MKEVPMLVIILHTYQHFEKMTCDLSHFFMRCETVIARSLLLTYSSFFFHNSLVLEWV